MEFACVGIQNIVGAYRLDGFLFRGRCRFDVGAFPICIINADAGLHVIGEHAEGYARAPVLHGAALQQHAVCQQVIPVKDRRNPVQHMVFRLFYIVGYHILKGKHTFYIEIPGAGDKVLGIGVFAGKLVAYQVAAVVKVVAVHYAVIAHSMPAAGLYLADFPPFFRWHNVLANTGKGCAAAAQAVQLGVAFKGNLCIVVLREVRRIAVYLYIGRAIIRWDRCQVNGNRRRREGGGRGRGGAGCGCLNGDRCRAAGSRFHTRRFTPAENQRQDQYE